MRPCCLMLQGRCGDQGWKSRALGIVRERKWAGKDQEGYNLVEEFSMTEKKEQALVLQIKSINIYLQRRVDRNPEMSVSIL